MGDEGLLRVKLGPIPNHEMMRVREGPYRSKVCPSGPVCQSWVACSVALREHFSTLPMVLIYLFFITEDIPTLWAKLILRDP